MEKGVQSGTSS